MLQHNLITHSADFPVERSVRRQKRRGAPLCFLAGCYLCDDALICPHYTGSFILLTIRKAIMHLN